MTNAPDETRPFQRAQPLPQRLGAGPTLADALAREPLPPLPWAVWIAKQAATQLDLAHRMGVVPGRVGLKAFALVDGPRGEELILDADLAATPLEPPEARSKVFPRVPLSTASDLWSLGAIVHQLLAGAPPPYDPTGAPVPPPARAGQRIPDAVTDVVRRLLDHAPQARPSAGDVLLALARAERELAATGERGLSWERGSLMAERWRLVRELPGDRGFLAVDERAGALGWARPLRWVEEPERRATLAQHLERARERHDELAHRALPRIVDVIRTDDGSLGYVQTAAEGTPLLQLAAPLEPGQVHAVLEAVAGGLAALHSRGVTGAGLEPSDLIVGADRRSAVLSGAIDDALLRALAPGSSGVGVIRSLAPEVLSGARGRGEASDRYDLGVLAFWVATGRAPFPRGPTLAAWIKAHLEQAPPRARALRPDLPPLLDDLIDGLLAKDPARRPTAAAVARALKG